MNIIKTLETPVYKVSLLDNGLLYLDYTIETLDDVAVLQKQPQEIIKAFDKDEFYIITNTSKIKRVSKEVRNFSAHPDSMRHTKILAILLGSGVSRMIGNFYLKFSKSNVPTKLFTNFEKAQTWILEEKAKIENVK